MITTETSGPGGAPRTAPPHSPRAMTALVVGGTGAMGAGVVRALLRAGARVLVPSRGRARLAGLRAAVGGAGADRLSGVEATLGTLHGAATVQERVATEYGRLDALIAAFGPRPPGMAAPYGWASSFPPVLDETLTAHFVTAAAFLPQRAAQGVGSYTVVSASLPEAGYAPGVQPLSLAGLLLLVRAFRQEAQATGIRVNVVALGARAALVRGRTAARAGGRAPPRG